MSNIAVPNRTEPQAGPAPAPAPARAFATARLALGAVLMGTLFMTLSPFAASFEGDKNAGDIVNQLGYSALAALALAGHVLFTDRTVALSLLRPVWLAMGAWLFVTSALSANPENAFRTSLFVTLAMIAATGATCLPRDARDFKAALALGVGAVVGLSYFGVVALPSLGMHTGAEDEAQHAGLWRGVYSHKNIAGAMMGAFFFMGLYLLRSNWRWIGGGLAVLSALFVMHTGSKTSMILLPAVALVVTVPRLVGGRLLPVVVIFAAICAMALLTLGSVMSPTLDAMLQAVMPGTTFTGRTDLWHFALDLSASRQWTGFGLNSFWQTDFVYGAERDWELAWDTRHTPNGHSGYLDTAIAFGWPGLGLAMTVLLVMPLADYLRIGDDPERSRLADMFLMVLTYLLLNAFLESFLFERANPIWMTLWISVVGLRLLARHPVAHPV